MMLYRILVPSPFHCLVRNPPLNCTPQYLTSALKTDCADPVPASQATGKLCLRPLGQVCFVYRLHRWGSARRPPGHTHSQLTGTALAATQPCTARNPRSRSRTVFHSQAGTPSLDPAAAPKYSLQEGSRARAPGSGLGSGPRPSPASAAPRPARLLPPGYLELEGALGALGDLLVETLLGVVGQLERDLGGPRRAGRQRPHQQPERQRPPGAPRRHRQARREATRARRGSGLGARGCGAAGLRGCGAAGGTRRGRGDGREHPEAPARRQRLPGALPGRVSGGAGRGKGEKGGERAGKGRAGPRLFPDRGGDGGWVLACRHCPRVVS